MFAPFIFSGNILLSGEGNKLTADLAEMDEDKSKVAPRLCEVHRLDVFVHKIIEAQKNFALAGRSFAIENKREVKA